MVGPVAYNAQAQIPAANTFQPGGQTGQAQTDAEVTDTQETRPTGTSAAESQETETRNPGREEATVEASADTGEDNGAAATDTTRGSTVDISV